MIFDIQRYAIHDGMGIRTLIFFKGCPLRCKWCDNPESQSIGYDIMWDKRLCMGCGDCASISDEKEIEFDNFRPILHRDKIKNYLQYKNICPTGALKVVGEDLSVKEIIREIKKDIPFYRKSYGGVTISGGEPFMQPDFLEKLLKELKAMKINTAIETSLYVKWEEIKEIIPFIDTFLTDVKHVDSKKFKIFTGGNLNVILNNFFKLSSVIDLKRSKIIARVPVIPDFNATDKEMISIFNFIKNLRVIHETNLIPYHTLGVGKYELLGRNYLFHPKITINDKMLDNFCNIAKNVGLQCTIGG